MDNSDSLHVVVFPFIRFSHLNPFLRLSKHLVGLGHRVSFLSTTANIHTIAAIPSSTLSPLIHLIPLHIPATDADVVNLDTLRYPFAAFLQSLPPPPDWILFDSGYYWVPRIAAGLGVPCCYVNLVGAAANVFMWPFFALAADGEAARVTVERLTAPPDWIPFPTSMKLHRHEARQLLSFFFHPSMSGLTNGFRVGSSVRGSDLVAVESCTEFEPEWLAAPSHISSGSRCSPSAILPPAPRIITPIPVLATATISSSGSTGGKLVRWCMLPSEARQR